MRASDWIYPLTRLLAMVLVAGLIGWAIGYPRIVVSGFLALYLGWQFYNVVRLHNWLQDPNAKPPGGFGMWAAIFDRISTNREQVQQKNRLHRKQIKEFEGIAKAFPDAILLIDSSGLIRWFNESASRLLQPRPISENRQAITSLIRAPSFSEWMEEKKDGQQKLIINCPTNDRIILQLRAVEFTGEQRLLILRDITAVQNTERMRRDLVANVSHELRTPLTVLLGYLEVLKAQPGEAKPKTIKRMLKQARQMHSMLEELLALSRLQDIDNRTETALVDMPALLAQLSEQAEDLSQGEHRITFEIDQNLRIMGVEADLKSAFQNLLVNAVNYTPESGEISVSWSETPEGLVLSVKDNGVGIPDREIPRLTERFYRVGGDRNRKTGGTGLGLAIVKHVLNNHDARLEITSEVSVGSEFRCVFPLDRKA